MKRFANGRSRLLSLVLSLVLLVSLVPAISLPASADDYPPNLICTGITVGEKYSPSGCLKTMTISYHFNEEIEYTYAPARGKFAVHNGAIQNKFGKPLGSWPSADTIRPVDGTFIAFQNGSDFWWTDGQDDKVTIYTKTVEFADNVIEPNEEYYLYLWTLANNPVYPDCFFAKIKLVNDELQVRYNIGDTFDPPAPAHVWNPTPVTTGNGTKEAVTTVTCSCGTQVRVSLTASDVTLPGNAFSAKIDVEEIPPEVAVAAYSLRARSNAVHELTISDTPGYKYSPDGTNFTEIDPNTFTPAPGFYQASILVKDGNTTLENLYVTYTVRDPAVTAETGDSRPIELMVMGMALFSALAIAAFVLDSRRKANR